MEPEFNAGKSYFGPFPTRKDIDGMADAPPKRGSHRRAHSDTFFRLPDDDNDLLFDVDGDADFSLTQIDLQALNMSEPESNSALSGAFPAKSDESNDASVEKPKIPAGASGSHFRSLSVDAAFFDGLGFQPPTAGSGEVEKPAAAKVAPEKRMHRHSNSMDGSSSSFEADSSMDYTKKAMTAEKLAELALIDPKRAKRILANRQSAARSKERKIRYTSELERKVQTLQTEATTLSAQLTLLQRDTNGLTAENKELKLRLQAMEQQAQLRDALNDALREEVQRLKIATGQLPPINNNNNSFNRGPQQSTSSFFSPAPSMNQFGNHQSPPLHMSQSSPSGQSLMGQSPNCSMDFMRGSNLR
ncbi:hypothetical protein H6P81_006972 [Aristolochia fimbriata]|uniref:BZIP domain-containing protein n=1 Tax=Aristolochia fimbriata TaxID=158543 RepID=A0AAV7F3C3_ARIFI|nr:hypothetical protein H6P81_006972 [Aristolochia fimbriata]